MLICPRKFWQYEISFLFQKKFKVETEVENWIQKYDADMGERQVNKTLLCIIFKYFFNIYVLKVFKSFSVYYKHFVLSQRAFLFKKVGRLVADFLTHTAPTF